MTTGQFVAGFLLLIGALLAYHIGRARRGARVFRMLAEKWGGRYTPGYFWEAGIVQIDRDGLSVKLDIYTTPSRDRNSYTRMAAQFPCGTSMNARMFANSLANKALVTGLTRIPLPMSGWRGELVSGLREDLAQEVSTGDEEFNRQFMLRGDLPDTLKSDLIRNLRALNQSGVHQAAMQSDGAQCYIHFELRGEVYDAARLEALFEVASSLSHSLGVSAPNRHPVQ